MKEFLFLVAGVVATLIVSHYYFRRTVAKSLTPFLHFSTALFRGIAPEVREALRIEYHGVAVEELMEVQFLIANTGERAISNVLAPLKVGLPENCFVVDATLLHISPPERQINVAKTEQEVTFDFPLLNRREFFLARLLLRGEAFPNSFTFTITAEDLPATLPAVPLSPDSIGTSDDKRFQPGAVVAAIVFAAMATATGLLAYDTWATLPRPFSGKWQFAPALSLQSVAVLISAVLTIVVGMVSLMMLVAAFGGGSFPPRRRMFVLPRALIRHRLPGFAASGGDSPPTHVYSRDA